MSRKFDRRAQVQANVNRIMKDPRTFTFFFQQIVRPKPKYFPKFLWRYVLKLALNS